MEAYWSAWNDATSEKPARNVAAHLVHELARDADDLTFAPYPKRGWTFSFQTCLAGVTWSDYVNAGHRELAGAGRFLHVRFPGELYSLGNELNKDAVGGAQHHGRRKCSCFGARYGQHRPLALRQPGD